MDLIECCLGNVTSDARRELHDSDEQVRVAICLDRCGTCCERPFLIVDGDVRKAESFSTLLGGLDRCEEGSER